MDFSIVNWWAVLIGVVLSIVSGFIWYSPKVFFNTWWNGLQKKEDATGSEEEMKNSMIYIMGLTVLTSFTMATTVAMLTPLLSSVMSTGEVTVASGALTGFMLWLGLIVPSNLVNKLFAGYKPSVFFIEIGNHLINMVVYGVVVGLFA